MSERGAEPHFPHLAPIDAYGAGGFRFAGMSHRGSLLCLPERDLGVAGRRTERDRRSALARVFSAAQDVGLFLLGAGRDPWIMPEGLRRRVREAGLSVDVMTTGAAVRTYNILLGERRRVAAGLIAVESSWLLVAAMHDAFAHCEQVVREADKDRFLATLFAPANRRAALMALYAFNAEIARVREAIRDPMAGEVRLQWWRDAIERPGTGEARANPIASALLDTVVRFRLPIAQLLDLIEARELRPLQRSDAYADGPRGLRRQDLVRLFDLACAPARRPSRRLVRRPACRAGLCDHRPAARVPAACGARAALPAARTPGAPWGNAGGRRLPDAPRQSSPRRWPRCATSLGRMFKRTSAPRRSRPRSRRPCCRSPWCRPIWPGWSGLAPTIPVADVPQWRRQWILWRAARRSCEP